MGDLSFAEGKAFDAEGEITGHRVAVTSVESSNKDSVLAIGQNILQR